jgi:hypothetical protein
MIDQVTTQNGSVYLIDHDKKTWTKTKETERSGLLRTPDGSFTSVFIEMGRGMEILCPPFIEGAIARLIYTSDVVRVERLEE